MKKRNLSNVVFITISIGNNLIELKINNGNSDLVLAHGRSGNPAVFANYWHIHNFDPEAKLNEVIKDNRKLMVGVSTKNLRKKLKLSKNIDLRLGIPTA